MVASRFGSGEFDPYQFIALRLSIATLTIGLGMLLIGSGLYLLNRRVIVGFKLKVP